MGHNRTNVLFLKGVANMNLTAWSLDYWREAERVRERIELLRRGGPAADQEEELLIQRRMRILYDMYLDCVHTARYLERRGSQREEG